MVLATQQAAAARFEAMGTRVHVIVVGREAERQLGDAVAMIEMLEARWSRFRDGSEINSVNARAGTWATVSPATFALVDLAIEGWRITAGRFDPTVLGDVIRAGYDRSFVDITEQSAARASSPLQRGCGDIDLDARRHRVRLPDGVGFDPGGIGKGLAADLVVEAVRDAGADGACVNIGGDVRVSGATPDGAPWTVEIEPDEDGAPVRRLHLVHGAVATSATSGRAWKRHGAVDGAHHVIDPATGQPARGAVSRASVVAGHGWQAEVLTKALLLSSVAEALALATRTGVAARVVTHDGAASDNARWRADATGAAR